MVRVSPGVYTNELQFTQVAVQISRTRPLIVGGATKGPVNKPVVITSELDLIDQFGIPISSDLGLLSAVEYLKRGNTMVYLRVANAAVAAQSNLKGKPVATTGVRATGKISLTGQPADGDTVTMLDSASVQKIFEFDKAVAATGSLIFTGQPTDGQTLIINDGYIARTFEFDTVAQATATVTIAVGNAADGNTVRLTDAKGNVVTFEFESTGGVTQGNVAVTIGAANTDSATNLRNAINAQQAAGTLRMTASVTTNVVTCTQDDFGVAGNTTITVVGANLSKTDFTGGEDLAATAGSVAVRIGTTFTLTATNLKDAIEAQTGYKISAALVTATVNLTNDEPGADGASAGSKNTAIIGAPANVAVSGMAGGVNSAVGVGNVVVTIGASTLATATNLVAAINAVANYKVGAALNTTAVDPAADVTQDDKGTTGNTTITKSGTNITVTGFSGGVTEVLGADINVLTVAAYTPGTWADTMTVAITASSVLGAAADHFDIAVTAPVDNKGTLQVVERFKDCSMTPTLVSGAADPRFVQTVVNEGVRGEVNPSTFIKTTQLQPYKPNNGTFTVSTDTKGNDGLATLSYLDIVGSVSGNTATGLKAAENSELIDFNILAVPGWANDSRVITAMQGVSAARGDCFLLIDPPFGLTVQGVIDWHNGIAFSVPNSPTAPINDNSAGVFWPWIRVYSQYLLKNIWLPPSAAMLGVFAFADDRPGPWFAPAGYQRGQLNDVIAIEYSPLQSERDLLLGGTSRINPFVQNVDSSGTRFVLLGNVTSTRTPGPLDAIHVKRMVLFAKKLSASSIRFLMFDPNDPVTQRNVEQTLDPIFQNIQDQRGLEFFDVICDATTNPPAQKAKKTLKAKILLKHIDASEIIELDFALLATGAEFAT